MHQIDRACTMKNEQFLLSATFFGEKKNQDLWVKCSHMNVFIKWHDTIWSESFALDIRKHNGILLSY